MKRLIVLAAALLVAAAAIPALAAAHAGAQERPMLGLIYRAHGAPAHTVHVSRTATTSTTNSCNFFSCLRFHNGPVMPTNQVYAIFMAPSGDSAHPMSAGYQSTISRYFSDVAADNGKTSNVYFDTTQYYGPGTQYIGYNSSLAGSWSDSAALPASDCTDSGTSACLSDTAIQNEVNKAMQANGWTAGPNKLFFVFTPKNVGSCDQGSCSFSSWCAYHSWIGSGSSATLYANMPYADTNPSACDAGQHPNASSDPGTGDADATLNVTSHEHIEAITDPQGSAWYDRSGNEIGDKCAWNFGSSLGGSSGNLYNQLIAGDHYYLQREWSNRSGGCVRTGLTGA